MTLGIALYIDGVKVADGSPDDDPTAPYAIDGLTSSWGRPTTVDQPDASSCSFVIHARTTWPDPDLFAGQITLGRSVAVAALDAAGTVAAWVFVGSITDVSMVAADDDPTLLILNVTADDVLADLDNRPAGTTPWPKESVSARFGHVIGVTRVGTLYTVATNLAAIQVRKLDADSGATSMAASLLADIATSTDGVLWSSVTGDGDPLLYLESPGQRVPLRRLALVGVLVEIVDVTAAANALAIDPCVPDLAPIEFRQTMSDLVTGVSVTYYTPDPEDATAPDIGTTITVADPAAESPSRPWGVRRMDVDSQLTSSADSVELASKVLARLSTPSWRLNNVTVDQAQAPTLGDADMRRLLGADTRIGLPITIYPLPDWAPPDSDTFTGYLEGGDITSTAGVWSTSLWLSLAQGFAGVSARWIDLPDSTDWAWEDFDPDISWADLTGVGGPV